MKKRSTPRIGPGNRDLAEVRHISADRDLEPERIVQFKRTILSWYEHRGRDLPWRRTTDPYCILVSEIMLQQTQVARVTVKYPEFIKTFPTFAALAGAPFPEVLGRWQGLGYNRRALAIHRCAKEVMTGFDGGLPQDVGVLETLPGIGHATACSIAAFAFNMPVVFIETNIRRVFIHFFFQDRQSVTDRAILPFVAQSLYTENPRIWYWALMDYGSALKTSGPNPNRRSARYTRQKKFEGSDRQIRGSILKSFVQNPRQDPDTLVTNLHGEPGRIQRIIDTLVKEGFLCRDQGTLEIRVR